MQELLKIPKELEPHTFSTAFEKLIAQKRRFMDSPKGNAFYFSRAVEKMPSVTPSFVNVGGSKICIGSQSDLTIRERTVVEKCLYQLCPWRKGPFNVFGIDIDSEWQSWIKWERFQGHMEDLKNRNILDIGSSNGYYMFRMAAHDPLMVVGIEPQHSFYYQYLALQNFLRLKNVYTLPVRFHDLPEIEGVFDTVFCMGVLYHRHSPVRMLKRVHGMMKKGAQLIVENLVLRSQKGLCLFPESRYAKMRNVFFIPDLKCMDSWLRRSGFSGIKCINVSKTTEKEQRKTPWIHTETLADFLDPVDNEKTVEGYPAPVRAVFTAYAG